MNNKEKQTKQTKQNLYKNTEIDQSEETIKERTIDDVLVNLYGYIYFLEMLSDDNQNTNESKVIHMGLLVDKMHEEINKLAKYYDFIEMFNNANERD